jgi:hypothetical protein
MPDQEAAVDLNELAMAKLRGFVEYSRADVTPSF